MKKILLLVLIMVFVICGCGKKNNEDNVNNFVKKIEKLDSYYLKGNMEIVNDEESYLYDLEVSHKKDDLYSATLINQTNNHKQIILKNNDGVYVVTPSLNKSYKFQSEWPHNSTQVYILESIMNDIKNDKEKNVEETESNIIITVKANYSNNPTLVTEKIYFDKNMNLKSIIVFDTDGNEKISMIFSKIDYKATINDEVFNISNYIDEEISKNSNPTSLIDNIIYPLHVPEETYLKDKETITTDTSERIILTFAGEKDFILIEEQSVIKEEFEIIPVYGEPLLIDETFGYIEANSLVWSNSGIDYYLSSNELSNEEMLKVASSLNNNTISVSK